MDRKKTTSEVVPDVGLTHQSLINYLTRHPELRPGEKLPSGDYLWASEDIERLAEFRMRPIRRGPRNRNKR